MEESGFYTQRKVAAAALCMVLLVLTQQVHAGPVVTPSSDHSPHSHGVHVLRRIARMTPLWRIMNSKPFGAYCQNNYECSTGLCRAGHCSTNHRPSSEPVVNY
ncbi:liver-expressed antimicrobial peptide 2 [Parambassis ranga]|uniref:Liver-expressed antimicrobial peptide 2 n=1 Tax=Parambassis ranga TaxID=210632 RepID=A0A6P7I6V3_9TELE|nr:liver-expressed antimicrobial peptide 2-like [Parambassis ranga]